MMTAQTRARILRLDAEVVEHERLAEKARGRLRSAFVLARADGATLDEIASLCGVTRQAVWQALKRTNGGRPTRG